MLYFSDTKKTGMKERLSNMCYRNEEDYFEPGEFDEEIEDLKEKLRNSVKQETKDTIEKLRKENQELQSIKKNFESIKNDFEKKKHEYEIAMRNAEYKAKQSRLSELMENNKVIVYGVESEHLYKKKCDKCDINRNIQITLPSGRVVDDSCKCNLLTVKWGRKWMDQMKDRYLFKAKRTDNEELLFYCGS